MGVSIGGSGENLPSRAYERGVQQGSSPCAAVICTAYTRGLLEASCSIRMNRTMLATLIRQF
jgi:hypothetical protein